MARPKYNVGDIVASYCGAHGSVELSWSPNLPGVLRQDLQAEPFNVGLRSLDLQTVVWEPPSVPGYDGFLLRRFCSLLIYSKPGVGLFAGIHKTSLEDRSIQSAWYPIKQGPRLTMTRIWLGDRYVRVPTDWLLTPEETLAVATHFWETQGDLWSGLTWTEQQALDWRFHLHPEDDIWNKGEPFQGPASQTVLTAEEVFQKLGLSWDDFL